MLNRKTKQKLLFFSVALLLENETRLWAGKELLRERETLERSKESVRLFTGRFK